MQKIDKNKSIDKYLRTQYIRKLIVASSVAMIFIFLMSYALYKEYGPDSETVNIFSDISTEGNEGSGNKKTKN